MNRAPMVRRRNALAGFDSGDSQADRSRSSAYSEVHAPRCPPDDPDFADDYSKNPKTRNQLVRTGAVIRTAFPAEPFRIASRIKASDDVATRNLPVQYRYMKDAFI